MYNKILLSIALIALIIVSIFILWCVENLFILVIDLLKDNKADDKAKLEALSFTANILLSIIAIIAGTVAYKQLVGSERTRLANLYMSVSLEWDALSIYRQSILRYVDGIDEDQRGQFIRDKINSLSMDLNDDLEINDDYIETKILDESVDAVLSYLEDLGLLCRKRYVSIIDIADIMGATVVNFLNLLRPHVESVRNPECSRTIYANTIFLYEELPSVPRFGIDGYGYKPKG